MTYKRHNWENGMEPAIDADNLNEMEAGIGDALDGVDELKILTEKIKNSSLMVARNDNGEILKNTITTTFVNADEKKYFWEGEDIVRISPNEHLEIQMDFTEDFKFNLNGMQPTLDLSFSATTIAVTEYPHNDYDRDMTGTFCMEDDNGWKFSKSFELYNSFWEKEPQTKSCSITFDEDDVRYLFENNPLLKIYLIIEFEEKREYSDYSKEKTYINNVAMTYKMAKRIQI